MSTTPPLPEHPAATGDPVAAFLDAHDRGHPVALGTSGSSGAPRSVVRSTASWVASFPHVSALTGIGPGSRVWVPGPLSATMNLFAAVHARWAGARGSVSLEGATHAVLTPSALHTLLDDRAALAGVGLVVAGDRLSPALADRARAAGATVHHYYGAAELSFVAWGADAESLTPFPAVDVDVRDGEIWVRSPYLCDGYDGPPGPLRWDADGFATVGDRGCLEGGTLRVTGREGAVTTAGGTVHLADVEALLRPGASGEVVALGLPHDRLGQVLAVALTDPADHGPLRRRARERLAGAHLPRLWFALPDLPRTGGGKVDRAALATVLGDPGGAARRLA